MADQLWKLVLIVCSSHLHETENCSLFSGCLARKPTVWHQLAVIGIFNKSYLWVKNAASEILCWNKRKTGRWDLSCKTSAGAKVKCLIRVLPVGGGVIGFSLLPSHVWQDHRSFKSWIIVYIFGVWTIEWKPKEGVQWGSMFLQPSRDNFCLSENVFVWKPKPDGACPEQAGWEVKPRLKTQDYSRLPSFKSFEERLLMLLCVNGPGLCMWAVSPFSGSFLNTLICEWSIYK